MTHKLKQYEAPSLYDNEDCVARATSDVYLAFEADAVIAEYAAREKQLRELAESWCVCTWGHYQNPGIELLAILNEDQSKPSA